MHSCGPATISVDQPFKHVHKTVGQHAHKLLFVLACRWGMRGRIWCLFLYQASAGLWVALLGHSSSSYPATIAFIVLAAFAIEVSLLAPLLPMCCDRAAFTVFLLKQVFARVISLHAACQNLAEAKVTPLLLASLPFGLQTCVVRSCHLMLLNALMLCPVGNMRLHLWCCALRVPPFHWPVLWACQRWWRQWWCHEPGNLLPQHSRCGQLL